MSTNTIVLFSDNKNILSLAGHLTRFRWETFAGPFKSLLSLSPTYMKFLTIFHKEAVNQFEQPSPNLFHRRVQNPKIWQVCGQ